MLAQFPCRKGRFLSATDFLRRAKIATQAFADVANWREVLPLAATGKAVTEIRLRSGAVIKASPDGSLWPVFSDIWYHHSYTKHCPISPGSTVVDVGANVGVFSLFAARVARTVYALEPASSNFSRLIQNVSQAKNVISLHCACAGHDGRATLDLSREPIGISLLTTSPSGSQETVDVVSLETLFAIHKINRCDFLKLDCEGAEYPIILDTPPAVLHRVQRIVLEYHDHLSERFSHRDLTAKLRSLGFHTTEYNTRGSYGMLAAMRV